MNAQYTDATPEEIEAVDKICTICHQEMTTACKKLPCDHIFHADCIQAWFQREPTCPVCRLDASSPRPAVYPAPDQFLESNPSPNCNFLHLNMEQPDTVLPFMPYSVLPMAPPLPYFQDLKTLSTEELRRLEAVEKRNVEIRLEYLKNIELTLNSAADMIDHYNIAKAVTSIRSQTPNLTHSKDASLTRSPKNKSASTSTTGLDTNSKNTKDVTATRLDSQILNTINAVQKLWKH